MEPLLPADILLNVIQVMGEPQAECDGGTQVAGIGNFACQIEGRIDVNKGRYRFWIGSPGRKDGDPPACPADKLPELARLVVNRLPSS